MLCSIDVKVLFLGEEGLYFITGYVKRIMG